ncbi:MAG: hypothetical protein HYX44_15500 [Aquabacterium sp.]|nr:hypothetical protein [Aquabacterium sp.]
MPPFRAGARHPAASAARSVHEGRRRGGDRRARPPPCLSGLSEEDRDAITECDLKGMSQEDDAHKLGLSLPGAKSRIQRARKRLRAQLTQSCQVTLDPQGQVCCFVPRP